MIRRIVLDPETGDLDPRAEALLYAADKAHHLHEVVRPALGRGELVICDRYVDSMLAYQGAGRVLDPAEVTEIARWATGGLSPDLTVLLDLALEHAVGTIAEPDRVEGAGADFHERARALFLELAAQAPERYLVLPARESVEWIAERVRTRVGELGGAVVGGGWQDRTMTVWTTWSGRAGGRGAAARGRWRRPRDDPCLADHRPARIRPLGGPGVRGGPAVRERRLRRVLGLPDVAVGRASRRHPGAYRAAVDRRRRGATWSAGPP